MNKKVILPIIVIVLLLVSGLIVKSGLTSSDLTSIPVPTETATPESAISDLETNADGYGEEILTQTEDGSYLDGEASDDEEDLSDESEQSEVTATPAPAATATPAPAATPQPTAVPQPAATAVPQPAAPQPEQVTQPDQSSGSGSTIEDMYNDDSWNGYDYDFDWGATVLE